MRVTREIKNVLVKIQEFIDLLNSKFKLLKSYLENSNFKICVKEYINILNNESKFQVQNRILKLEDFKNNFTNDIEKIIKDSNLNFYLKLN
jgi:hypothetical protein